jgi:hypothetical protein
MSGANTSPRRWTSSGPAGPRSASQKSPGVAEGRRYPIYLIVIATAGWALASYDFNLLLTLPVITTELKLSQVRLLAFFVYIAMLIISLTVGYSMNRFGRSSRPGSAEPPSAGSVVCTPPG